METIKTIKTETECLVEIPECYICEVEKGNVINTQKIVLEKKDKNSKPKDMGEVSDGYHTFNELYESMRILRS